MSNIAIIGSGYVGTTLAAILANCGHKVTAIDIDEKKTSIINSGKAPFYERGLDFLLLEAVRNGRLQATSSYEHTSSSDIVFSCVGTPDNPDGSSNLQYVFASAKKAAKLMPRGSIFVQKSTVPVGTGGRVEKEFSKIGKNVSYISSPEFLREGSAIADMLWFDRVVVGGENAIAVRKVVDLYRSIEGCRKHLADIGSIKALEGVQGSYVTTSRNSAELIKVTSNAFLALKISFANSIAKLADQTDADVNEVMDAVGADKRIGRAFLNAGRGYGGGCFPKDVSGLIASATEHSVDMPIMTAATEVNESMPGYIANRVMKHLGALDSKKVAILGLAFKAGTSDSRRSPGVALANIFDHDGAEVRVYDPRAVSEARNDLRKTVFICASLQEAISGVDAILVATEWQEFLDMDFSKLKGIMKGNLFVDCQNIYSIARIESVGLNYLGVGRRGVIKEGINHE